MTKKELCDITTQGLIKLVQDGVWDEVDQCIIEFYNKVYTRGVEAERKRTAEIPVKRGKLRVCLEEDDLTQGEET